MQNYDELRECVIAGKKAQVAELVRKHLDEGKTAKDVMDNGLIPGMAIVGKKFQEGEFFIPEMLMAARSLNAGLEVLRPLLEASDVKPVAKVLMGTVKGDIHDIGKNLVAVMLRGGGFEVIDAGVDVPPDKFVELARENGADLIGLSALLTTTMPSMKDTIDAFQSQGYRENVKIMIGGAPITQEYADEIGADGFARNASYAVELAKKLLGVAA
ncbi:MAG: corrinoid protein [Deferribacteres bacterium]|nr:corrinoid protein [candidate division KSB1 bacterium]MCB9509249.1 corrinoid protein [Deferribacteres bacterium]